MTNGRPTRTLAREAALAVADLYMMAGTHISAPHPELHVASKSDPSKLGICIAATTMLKVLSQYGEGLDALREFFDKPDGYCPVCGSATYQFTLLADPFSRWACDCGATGRVKPSRQGIFARAPRHAASHTAAPLRSEGWPDGESLP